MHRKTVFERECNFVSKNEKFYILKKFNLFVVEIITERYPMFFCVFNNMTQILIFVYDVVKSMFNVVKNVEIYVIFIITVLYKV